MKCSKCGVDMTYANTAGSGFDIGLCQVCEWKPEPDSKKHSPLPWEIEHCHTGEGCWCRLIKHSEVGWDNQDEIDEPYVNIAGSIPKEDAEFIVKACNAHYELVEALDSAYRILDTWHAKFELCTCTDTPCAYCFAIEHAKTVLLKSKEANK